MEKPFTYENRFVLFLDILGFKKKVDATYSKEQDLPLEIEKLYNALETISESNARTAGSKRFTQFSDSIVVSFNDSEEYEFSHLLDDISIMLYELASQGIFCRGAIAYGKFLHDEKFLFGPALVEAYETESKAALYPRVIIDKSVLDVYKQKSKKALKRLQLKKDFVDNYLLEDMDDKLFIDYFYLPVERAVGPDAYVEYLEKLRSHISDELSRARAADIRVKYGWMKQKFNSTLIKLTADGYHALITAELQKRLRSIKPFG